MATVLLLLAKALLAGCFVALISHLSTALRPKMFAGLFAAAPSVAAASLVLGGLQKPDSLLPSAEGMLIGAFGMIACCLVATRIEPQGRALVASGVGWLSWAVVACGAYLAIWR